MKFIVYDIETYPNAFTVCMLIPSLEQEGERRYVVSPWRNDWFELRRDLWKIGTSVTNGNPWHMVGFNNLFFDYPVLHHVYHECARNADAREVYHTAYNKAQEIIDTPFGADRWKHVIWESDSIAPQIDLFRVHHFDNMARATSLKKLEFAMRSKTLVDLPYDPTKPLREEANVDRLVEYNMHDVRETMKFLEHSAEAIEFRELMTEQYGRSFMNDNDTKIGKQTFVVALEKRDVECFAYDENNKRKPRQTPRNTIDLSECILPFIKFRTPELRAVADWINGQLIKETKGVFTSLAPSTMGELYQYMNLAEKPKGRLKNLNAIVRGFQFDFGTGGIHGSTEPGIYYADDEHRIIDLDVTSYYPSIAIEHGFAPAHLGAPFVRVYDELKRERVRHPKGSVENAALKLALNGVYGDSNNKYSPFYDPKYTMCITINGQLMLAMLAEALMLHVPGLQMLQINTDGLTVRMPSQQESELARICKHWMILTKMQLERADYSRMFIRDVNNYIGEYEDGKVKRKGAYEYERDWHQNHSGLVVPKAAEANLLHGANIDKFVRNHTDMHDFMMLAKVPRNSRLMYGVDGSYVEVQSTSRYYLSSTGKYLVKVMPPLTGKFNERWLGFHSHVKSTKKEDVRHGNKIRLMNEFDPKEIKHLDYDFYASEAKKLVTPLRSPAPTFEDFL